MIVVTVKPDIAGMAKELERMRRDQIPAATMIALNRTARFVKDKLREEMPRAFDRPTAWTLNSLRTNSATKQKLIAEVMLKDRSATAKGQEPARILAPQVYGGSRTDKRSETLLRNAGILLPGYYIVPGAAAKLDSHGNISRAQMQKILSGLDAQFDRAQNSRHWNKRRKLRSKNTLAPRMFVVRNRGASHLAPGVWLRVGRYRLQPLLLFVRRPRYARRLRFFEVAEQSGAMRFRIEMIRAARFVTATQRPMAGVG